LPSAVNVNGGANAKRIYFINNRRSFKPNHKIALQFYEDITFFDEPDRYQAKNNA
jgi:hypothetical protein